MISIIVLSYRNPGLIRLCLRSLAKAMSPEGGSSAGRHEYEVIVVDNASTPETRAAITQDCAGLFPSLKIIPLRQNTGYTRGVNEGLRAASGQYILALNHDIVVQPGAVTALVEYLKEHPQVGLLGPRLMNFDNTHQDSIFRFYRPFTIISRRTSLLPGSQSERARFTMADADPSQVQQVDWVSGAAFMTTRQALEQVGYLDERFFHYFSDVDWAWRFWENGYTVSYYPMAAMYHYLGRTSKGRFGILDPLFNRATRWHIADAFRYFAKHGIRGKRPPRHADAQPTLISLT